MFFLNASSTWICLGINFLQSLYSKAQTGEGRSRWANQLCCSTMSTVTESMSVCYFSLYCPSHRMGWWGDLCCLTAAEKKKSGLLLCQIRQSCGNLRTGWAGLQSIWQVNPPPYSYLSVYFDVGPEFSFKPCSHLFFFRLRQLGWVHT